MEELNSPKRQQDPVNVKEKDLSQECKKRLAKYYQMFGMVVNIAVLALSGSLIREKVLTNQVINCIISIGVLIGQIALFNNKKKMLRFFQLFLMLAGAQVALPIQDSLDVQFNL